MQFMHIANADGGNNNNKWKAAGKNRLETT